MTTAAKLAFVQGANHVILFDGVCKLCHAWSRFIIRFDKAQKFKLAAVQSKEGAALMSYYQLQAADTPKDQYKTMYYLEDGQVYEKSTAFIRIMAAMPYPWRLLSVFRVIPRCIRDGGYNIIATYRYAIFGKYSQCTLPEPDHEQRLLRFDENARH
jgi:predicted DCC family thiol-disulfide oxidoreductase YuxK